MHYAGVLITVKDIQKSRYLYETVLGQEVADDYGANIPFKAGFCLHQADHFQKLIKNRPMVGGSNSFELYFEENGLEELQEIIKKHGLEMVHEIEEQPWKQRVLRFYDYDNNIIEAGEGLDYTAFRLYKSGMTDEEIARYTYLSAEQIAEAKAKFAKV